MSLEICCKVSSSISALTHKRKKFPQGRVPTNKIETIKTPKTKLNKINDGHEHGEKQKRWNAPQSPSDGKKMECCRIVVVGHQAEHLCDLSQSAYGNVYLVSSKGRPRRRYRRTKRVFHGVGCVFPHFPFPLYHRVARTASQLPTLRKRMGFPKKKLVNVYFVFRPNIITRILISTQL